MVASFDEINESVNAQIEAQTSQSNNQENREESNSQSTRTPQASEADGAKTPLEAKEFELEKVEKYKIDGKEYTSKELGTLIAREKQANADYTRKMQALSEERKSWETQRKEFDKFDNALAYDLDKVRKNPNLAQEFIRTYPESYHRHLRAVLESTSPSQEQDQVRQNHVPLELMTQVEQLRQFVEKQEVAKAEVEIEKDLNQAMSQFKYASKKEVLADIYEYHNSLPVDPLTGRKPPIPAEFWAKAAEASHNDRLETAKTYQKELINNQKQANSKARDVGVGGGVLGTAPKKYNSFKELNKAFNSSMDQ